MIRIEPWSLWMSLDQMLENAAGPEGRLTRASITTLPPLLQEKVRAALGNKRRIAARDAFDRIRQDPMFDAAWVKAAGTGRSARTLSRKEIETIADPELRALSRDLWNMEARLMRRIDPPRVDLFHDLDATLSEVFAGTVADICRDHNQTLDTLDYAREERLLPKSPLTLVHFDTHSDMYREPKVTSENIGTYINRLVQDGDIDTFYWVVPSATRQDERLQRLFWNPTLGPLAKIFSDGPTSQTFWVERASGEVQFEPPPAAERERYRAVAFRKLTLDELPSFAGKKNVWIDIDADYFANGGTDTAGLAHIAYQGAASLRAFAATLRAKELRPVLTTCALSPAYTLEHAAGEIRRFFEAILRNSATGDLLVGYHHTAAHTTNGAAHRGTTVPRSACKAYHLLAELARVDAGTYRPDSSIPLRPSSREAREARRVARTFTGSAEKAERVLAELDALDGRADRHIDLDIIEESVQLDAELRAALRRLLGGSGQS